METVRAFFAMGGYGPYVWISYGLTALVLVALVVFSVKELRHQQRVLRTLTGATSGRIRGHEAAAASTSSQSEE